MNISNEEYGELTKRRSHNSKLCRTIPMAFLIGGLICTLGEALLNLYGMAGLNKDEAGALTSITLVFLSILFTGLEWYDRIAQHLLSASNPFVTNKPPMLPDPIK